MKDQLKNAWKSWTIWFNTVMAAAITGLPMLADSLPQLQAYLPENIYKMLMLVVLVVNIGLRFKTNTSLAAK